MSRLSSTSPLSPSWPWGCAVLLLLPLCVAATLRAEEPAPAKTSFVATAKAEHGTACWHQGHNRTADGGRWTAKEFMAAHRSIPLGTQVRVVNLKTGRATTVRITDRGPYTRGRIIDLSPAAAREIGLVDAGIAKVRVEVLPTPPST